MSGEKPAGVRFESTQHLFDYLYQVSQNCWSGLKSQKAAIEQDRLAAGLLRGRVDQLVEEVNKTNRALNQVARDAAELRLENAALKARLEAREVKITEIVARDSQGRATRSAQTVL